MTAMASLLLIVQWHHCWPCDLSIFLSKLAILLIFLKMRRESSRWSMKWWYERDFDIVFTVGYVCLVFKMLWSLNIARHPPKKIRKWLAKLQTSLFFISNSIKRCHCVFRWFYVHMFGSVLTSGADDQNCFTYLIWCIQSSEIVLVSIPSAFSFSNHLNAHLSHLFALLHNSHFFHFQLFC